MSLYVVIGDHFVAPSADRRHAAADILSLCWHDARCSTYCNVVNGL